MQTIYAMSDIHGMLEPLRKRLDQLNLDDFRLGKAKLILLGDYIDRGCDSLGVLKTIYELQSELGESMVVLMGNHDKWFLDFLDGLNPYWLENSQATSFINSFMPDEDIGKINFLISRHQLNLTHNLVRKAMELKHKELLLWMKKLPLFYETAHQIYVHAGIDEDAEELWAYGTSDEMFIEKYPPTKGFFFKDIIAGHVSTSTASCLQSNHDIFYDGKSHFYIDGIDSYPQSAKEDECVIPLLQYVEEDGIGCYFSIDLDNKKTLICKKEW